MINRAAYAFAVVVAALFAMFIMLWILIQDARIAAAMVITAFAVLSLVGLGWAMSHLSHRNAYQQPTIYTHEAEPVRQLPEPARFVRTAENTYINRDVLQEDARKVLELRDAGYPAPRRALIENVLQTNDHERLERVLNYLAELGYVTDAKKGAGREWVT